jgi:resuscitation-promoting factor RpfB
MKRFFGWFKALSAAGKAGTILAVFIGIGIVGAAGQNSNHNLTPQLSVQTTTKSSSKPTTETKNVTATVVIPFTSSTVQDNTIAQGTTHTKIAGINGVKTQTLSVTYTNGQETSRKLVSEVVTAAPVNEVIAKGTYVAPTPPTNCPNGTYTNSAGNEVCSPYNAPSAPAGATAQCVDGTYSFSQSHSGTCSHHGGVAHWLN